MFWQYFNTFAEKIKGVYFRINAFFKKY